MKKIFKALAITAASAALCVGVAAATGCTGGNGDFEGSYSYENYGQTYGMSVKVTVKNNIITKVEDTTATAHPEWHAVSAGWEDYYVLTGGDVTPSAVYTITTKTGADIKTDLNLENVNNFRPTPFTIKIAVGENGVIKSYEIITNGSAPASFADRMPESFANGTWFVGKNCEDILKAFNNNIGYDKDKTEGNINAGLTSNELSTGASQSDFVCLQAAAFASANAEAAFSGKKISALTNYKDVIDVANSSVEIVESTIPAAPDWYKWSNASAAYWTGTESYLLQQYIGLSVDEVLAIHVFTETSGQPYAIKDAHNVARNPQLEESGLLVTGATQSSGRLLLAIQNALGK